MKLQRLMHKFLKIAPKIFTLYLIFSIILKLTLPLVYLLPSGTVQAKATTPPITNEDPVAKNNLDDQSKAKTQVENENDDKTNEPKIKANKKDSITRSAHTDDSKLSDTKVTRSSKNDVSNKIIDQQEESDNKSINHHDDNLQNEVNNTKEGNITAENSAKEKGKKSEEALSSSDIAQSDDSNKREPKASSQEPTPQTTIDQDTLVTTTIDTANLKPTELPKQQLDPSITPSTTRTADAQADQTLQKGDSKVNQNNQISYMTINSIIDGTKTTIVQKVKDNKISYTFKEFDNMQIVFTDLSKVKYKNNDNNSPTITVKESNAPGYTKNDKIIASYDITSNMVNGTFKYDILIPISSSNAKKLEVKYSEDNKTYHTIKDSNIKIINYNHQKYIKLTNLNHFTVFVVIVPNTSGITPPVNNIQFTFDNLDATDVDYTENGSHWRYSTCHVGYGDNETRVRDPYNNGEEYSASWTFIAPATGHYKMQASWSTHNNRARTAIYTIYDASGNTIATSNPVDQHVAGAGCGGWSDFKDIGINDVYLRAGQTYTVELTNPNKDGYLIADAIRFTSLQAPTHILVDDSWVSSSLGTEVENGYFYGYNAFDNIEDALDQIADNGVITVRAGSYTQDLTINRPVTINCDSGAVLDGHNVNKVAITIASSNVTIDGCEIVHFKKGIRTAFDKTDSSTWHGYQNITIRNNYIHALYHDYAEDYSTIAIQIGKNTDTFLTGDQATEGWGGYKKILQEIDINKYLNFSGLVIENTRIVGNNDIYGAVYLSAIQGPVTIRGNRIENVLSSGILLDSVNNVNVESNTIKNNKLSGIFISDSEDNDANYNGVTPEWWFSSGTDGGYDMWKIGNGNLGPRNISITGNTITNNGYYTCDWCTQESYFETKGNNGISVLSNPDEIEAHDNTITGNGKYGIANHLPNVSDGQVNALNNNWGDSYGPRDTWPNDGSIYDTNPASINGDYAFGNILYAQPQTLPTVNNPSCSNGKRYMKVNTQYNGDIYLGYYLIPKNAWFEIPNSNVNVSPQTTGVVLTYSNDQVHVFLNKYPDNHRVDFEATIEFTGANITDLASGTGINRLETPQNCNGCVYDTFETTGPRSLYLHFAVTTANDEGIITLQDAYCRDVTLCKVDDNNRPLSDWTLRLFYSPIEDINVPTDGSIVTSNNLNQSDYLLLASGTYKYRNPNLLADANFSQRLESDKTRHFKPGTLFPYWPWANDQDFMPGKEGYLGITVNNTPTDWGDVLADSHMYTKIYNNYSGQFTFQVKDTGYNDNVGSLNVKIFDINST